MTRLTVSMPMLNTPLGDLPAMAKLAEDAKFDGVWSYEFWRNPYIGLAGPALNTREITLGTQSVPPSAAPRGMWPTKQPM